MDSYLHWQCDMEDSVWNLGRNIIIIAEHNDTIISDSVV